MLQLIDAVASCLDRDSARRINKIDIDAVIAKRLAELHEKEQRETLTHDECAEMAFIAISQGFVAHLQQKSRAILRSPVEARLSVVKASTRSRKN